VQFRVRYSTFRLLLCPRLTCTQLSDPGRPCNIGATFPVNQMRTPNCERGSTCWPAEQAFGRTHLTAIPHPCFSVIASKVAATWPRAQVYHRPRSLPHRPRRVVRHPRYKTWTSDGKFRPSRVDHSGRDVYPTFTKGVERVRLPAAAAPASLAGQGAARLRVPIGHGLILRPLRPFLQRLTLLPLLPPLVHFETKDPRNVARRDAGRHQFTVCLQV